MLLFLCFIDYLRWSKEQLQFFEVRWSSLGTSGVNFGAALCPQGGIVDGAAMVIGDTGDGCLVDTEVGNVSWEADSESDFGSERLCRAR
jgi:hypothetical protein